MKIKRLCVFIMSLIVLSLSAATITDPLMEAMKSADGNELLQINIRMQDQYDVRDLHQATRGMQKEQKRNFVVSELQAFASYHQSGLVNMLESSPDVKNINPLWISNVVTCRATSEAIRQIAQRTDVKAIDLDEMRKMIDERERENSVQVPGQPGTREITWNVSHVGAPSVWSQGYNGAGVLVAVIDTGVNYNHQDLQDHMWTHASYPYHGYDFVNGDNNPMDDDGHGTHCAGTVAGDGTAGSQTGVAPEATIMALKVLDSSGSGTESGVWSAIQFAVAQGADVISMSLGWQHSWGVDRETWRDNFNNVLAAGMVASVAAGNEGDELSSYPIPDNVRTPGDCPPPWLHPDQTLTGGISSVICVGATDSSDNLAYFSSLGPCTWEDISAYGDYAYNSGSSMGIIRPDISAPGYNIKSLDYANTSGYEDGWNGTSMATPCNAGVIALMLSKNPNLTPAEIDQILEENSVQLAASKNNSFGSGRVNALAAVNAVPAGTDPPNAATNPVPSNGSTTTGIPGTISWTNGGGASSYTVYAGTNNGAPWNLINGQATTAPYISVSSLSYETTYYWKVDSHNANGDAVGTIWSFTTGSPADEDFETGDFTKWDWTFSGNANWIIDSSTHYDGSYSARSGVITHNQSSSLSITLNCTESGTVSFYRKVSSEASYDYLRFYIDDVQQDQWCGEEDWTYEAYYVNSSGSHTFRWTYNKDGSENNGSDCGWVDYIYFPPTETGPAEFSLSPTSINFGDVEIGQSSTETFQITNNGGETLSGSITTPLDFSVAAISRDFDPRYGRTRNTLSYSIPNGSSQSFNLTFQPQTANTYSNNVTITSNDLDHPTNYLPVTGTGVNPADITYTPSSFDETILIGEDLDRTLTIGNDGGVALNYNVTYTTGGRNRDDLLSEDFDSGIPGTWTIDDGGSTTDTWYGETAYNSNSLDGTPFAFVNSDAAGSGSTTDETMTSPVVNCSSYTNLFLDFDHYFSYIDGYGNEQGNVEVWDGSTWNTVWESGTASVGSWTTPDHQHININAYANGNLQVRFHYVAQYDFYWAVDNVSVTGDPSGPTWLSLDGGTSVSGNIASGGADVDVTIGFDASELSLGTYNATIYIASNDPDEASVEIPVSLEVTDTPPEPDIAVSPASMSANLLNGDTNTQTLSIENEGGQDLTWSATIAEVETRSTAFADFNSGLPSSWTINDYGLAGYTWNNVSNYNGNSFDGTNFMIVNSGVFPAGVTFYEELITPDVDTEGAMQIILELDHLFTVRTSEFAQISVFDGTDWQNIATWSTSQGIDFNNYEHPVFDISEYANANMQIRFMYNDFGTQGFFWAIDNVLLSIDENIEWLTIDGGDTVGGTIQAGDPATDISVQFDATGMTEGDYYKNIVITSNDPDEGSVTVPVTLHVLAEMEPVIEVDPVSLAFGDVVIGTSDSQQFTIENSGLATLTGDITTPAGYTATLVTRSQSSRRLQSKTRNTLTFSIEPGYTNTYNLVFEPVAEQAYNGDVTITNNAGDDVLIAITGNGVVPPQPSLSWDPASFTAYQATDTQTSQNLTIANLGSEELTYTATVQYPSRSRNDLVNETFDSGMPGDWTVTDGGATTATWEVVDSYSSSSYTLDGTPFAFVDSDAAGTYDMDETLATPVLDVEGYTSLTIEFDHYFNSYQAEIADVDVWDGTQWINLLSMSGSDVGAWGSPVHATYDLTSYVNDALQVRFHYYNANYEWYWAVDNVYIYGDGSTSPSWLTLDDAETVNGAIVAGGSDDVISVGFDSDGLDGGSYYASIILTSNDPDHASETIPVTLNIQALPAFGLTPASLDFGDVLVDGSETMQFTIENSGNGVMMGTITTIDGYTVSEAVTTRNIGARRESAIQSRNAHGYTIPASSSQTFDLTFEPLLEQTYAGDITITSDDPNNPSNTLAVTGIGYVIYYPEIDATPLSFDFIMEPDHTDQGTIQISNLDQGTLNWSANFSGVTRELVDAGITGFFSGGTLDGKSDVPMMTSHRTTFNGVRAQGDLLMQHDLETPSGSILHLGCEVLNGSIWTTAGGLTSSEGDGNYLYRFDTNGNLLNTYNQITTSTWGMRDMADDGTYLYAGDENGFYRIDPATGTQTTLFSGNLTLSCFRSLSYVPSMGFIAGNWRASYGNFKVFDASGTLLDELNFPSTLSNVYGSTYDPSDHSLWLSDISGSGSYQRITFYHYDIATEALTGESILVPVLNGTSIDQQAGGCCLSTDLIPGKVALCGIAQSDPDTFFAVELRDAPTWISFTTDTGGTLPAYGGPVDLSFEIDTSDMVDGETHTANIVISSDDPDEPTITIPISLTIETYPQFNLTPASLDFGDVAVQLNETLQFTIENNGSAEMTGTITTIEGYMVSEIETTRNSAGRKESTNAAHYRNALDYTIAPFSSQTFDLTFEPEAVQTYAGNIVITSNDTNYPSNLLAVTGNGVYVDFPDISVMPEVLNYILDPDASGVKSFTISNTGDAVLNYTIVETDVTALDPEVASLNGTESRRQTRSRTDWLECNPTTGDVATGSYQVVQATVNAAGMTAGDYQAILEVQSNDPDEPIVEVIINLHVNYEPYAIDDLSIQISDGVAYLTWSATTYATRYLIFAAPSPDGPFTQVGQTSITVWSNVITENSKYYIVKAKN